MNNNEVVGTFILTLMILIAVLTFTYLVFVGLAWIIITAFSLSYSPWLVGLALMAIKMIIYR